MFDSYHRLSSEEAFAYFSAKNDVDEKTFEGWIDNAQGWASRFKNFDWKVSPSLPTKFYPTNTLQHTRKLIDKHGRMEWDDPRYTARLKQEIELIHKNGTIDLLPYFFTLEEVNEQYAKAKLLTGPGRGSAAGLLLSYLLNITHVDPLKYDLSVDRFLTIDRVRSGKLPDIDQDLPSRDLLDDEKDGWLKKRFGDHFAQISVDSTLRLRNAVKDVSRMRYGRVPEQVEALTKKFSQPPQGVDDLKFIMGYDSDEEGHVDGAIDKDPFLKEYISKYPGDWDTVIKCLGLPRQKGRHAAGFIIANRPIQEFIPTVDIGGVRCTQYTAGPVESVGGIKMDFLVVKSLRFIGSCIDLIQSRSKVPPPDSLVINKRLVPGHRLVTKDGVFHDIWDLPPDQDVFADVACGKVEAVFQYDTNGVRQWIKQFNHKKPDGTNIVDSVDALAIFTALDRPGPLDMFVSDPEDETGVKQYNMLVEYAHRSRGLKGSKDILPIFDKLLPETKSILIFQEQLERIYKELTGCSGSEAEKFRSNVSKKKMDEIEKAYPDFISRASEKIGRDSAEMVWSTLCTWGQYGFNKSHAVCYATIAYACAYLKKHFPLEWWCGVLRNAEKEDINEKYWRYCGKHILLPDLKLSKDKFVIEGDKIRAPVGLLDGVGPGAQEQICKYMPYTDIQDFCDKIQAHREAGATEVHKEKVDKEGVVTTQTSKKLGYNSVHRGIVQKLIVSGAMDGLFDETVQDGDQTREIVLYDKLVIFERAMAKAAGKKKAEPVNPAFSCMGPLDRYCMRKEVLPAYSEDLSEMIPGITKNHEGRYIYPWGDAKIPVATGKMLEALEMVEMLPYAVTVALPVYIESNELFTYHKVKKASKFMVDLNGTKLELVKWPGRDGELESQYKGDATGKVGIFICTKTKVGKDLAIDEVILVHVQNPATGGEEK
jgi:DNA polymerase III alpha subunit